MYKVYLVHLQVFIQNVGLQLIPRKKIHLNVVILGQIFLRNFLSIVYPGSYSMMAEGHHLSIEFLFLDVSACCFDKLNTAR